MFSNRNMHYVLLLWLMLFTEKKLMGSDEGLSSRQPSPGSAGSRNQSAVELKEIIDRAYEFYQQEDYAQTISEFTKAIEKQPTNLGLYRVRIKCHLQMENYDAAIRDIRTILEIIPNSKEDRLFLATILFKAEKWDESIREIIATDDHNHIDKLGTAFMEKNEWNHALHCYNEAIKRNPNRTQYYRNRAQCATVMKNYELAVSDYKRCLSLGPPSMGVQEALVNVLCLANKSDEAVQKIIKLGTKATNFQKLVEQLLVFGKIDEALHCYDEAIKQNPQNSILYEGRGKIFMSKRKPEEAIADFEEACSLNSDSVDHRINLIKVFLEFKQVDKAIREMIKLSDYDLYNLAYHLFINGKAKLAIYCCTEAIRKAPKNEIHYKLRGNCYRRLSETELAIEDFRKSFEINSENQSADFLINFSELLLEIRNYEEAKKVLMKIIPSTLSDDDMVKVKNIIRKINEMDESLFKKSSVKPRSLLELGLGTSSRFEHETSKREEDKEGPRTTQKDLEMEAHRTSKRPAVDGMHGRKRKHVSHEETSNIQASLEELDSLAKAWTNELKNIVNPQQVSFAKKIIRDVLREAQYGTLRLQWLWILRFRQTKTWRQNNR